MELKELRTLKESFLRSCTYKEAKDVVETLEKVRISSYDLVDALEDPGSYLGFVSIIRDRVVNEKFDELSPQSKSKEKKLFLERLQHLLDYFQLSFKINQVAKVQNVKIQKQSCDIVARV